MKKIIRWLANVSGVTSEVRIETIKEIGGRLNQDHFWWNGGITFREEKIDVMNAFYLYAQDMKKGGIPDIQRVREEVYKLDGKYIGKMFNLLSTKTGKENEGLED